MLNILKNIRTRDAFRSWLAEHHDTERECYLALMRGEPQDPSVFYYTDAVEEVLCFGWTDNLQKPIDGITMQRFSPRRSNSQWSQLDIERCKRLEKIGLMTEAGRRVYPERFHEEYSFDPEFVQALVTAQVYDIFKTFPSVYQRIRADNVIFYKDVDSGIYRKKLKDLIKDTKEGCMVVEWTDHGRLTD